MIRFPFFGYPPYPYYYSPYSSIHKKEAVSSSNEKTVAPSSQTKNKKIPPKSNPFSFHSEGFSDPNQVILEILGIQLYLDDILILGLLFILYEEEVKDEMLFICLILLLLT